MRAEGGVETGDAPWDFQYESEQEEGREVVGVRIGGVLDGYLFIHFCIPLIYLTAFSVWNTDEEPT